MRTRSRDKRREPSPRGDAGVQSGRIGRTRAIPGVKAKEPQDAQIVFGDALCRIADEAHAARGDIGEAADIVVDRAVRASPTAR